MSCLFPGAPDVNTFWQNILGKVDAVSDPPPEAWDPSLYYDPHSIDTDRVYCKRGGFLDSFSGFDPLKFGIPPRAVGGDPDQWLALELARRALDDAGYAELKEETRHRTCVILGKGTIPNAGTMTAIQHGLMVTQTLEVLKAMHPELSASEIEELRTGLRTGLPPLSAETAPGYIPNIITGRIANRFDLMGPNFTVDAACASSLVAVQLAMRELLTGDCDLALAGGSHVWTPMPMLTIFCQLGALSHREEIRPFDKDADGTLLGEGIGFVVLKRLSDAERDRDPIYAVIRGLGVASDGRAVGVMAPRVEGEVLAMQKAYRSADVSPQSIGLIEAHGTGTPVGDFTEIEALKNVFGPRQTRMPTVAVGSVKSMISHTVPAAGVAGLIKASLALKNKVLPPTLHCDEPNPRFELGDSPFYINTETRPWIGTEGPRRAGVSAFGFGGINAHAVLEEHQEPRVREVQRAHRGTGNGLGQ
jgi:acyl transferase domain-containing protein